MSNYKYKNPLDEGMVQFKLTKKQHNELFIHRPKQWYQKYDYYLGEDRIILERTYTRLAVVVAILLFPVQVVLTGFEDAVNLISDMFNQKEKGRFVRDIIWESSETYKKIFSQYCYLLMEGI
jgi:hypothetical protein